MAHFWVHLAIVVKDPLTYLLTANCVLNLSLPWLSTTQNGTVRERHDMIIGHDTVQYNTVLDQCFNCTVSIFFLK
jgi:hypothetical protein